MSIWEHLFLLGLWLALLSLVLGLAAFVADQLTFWMIKKGKWK